MPKQNSRSTSKKAKEAEEKPSKPKKIHARKRFELSEEQKLLSDIPHLLSIGQSIPEILRSKPGLSKHHALRILQESFAQKIVSVSPTTPDDAKTGLGHIFPDVQFAVVPGSPQYFDDRATTQVLQWLTELCSRRPQSADDSTRSGAEDRPVIAWGGGMAIHDIATALRRVIELPANRNIKQWLNRNHGKLVFTNATAGGQPSNPKYEASYLAIVCAEATDQDVATYSLSRDSFHDELQIIDNAVRNTLVVISGVGDQETAYCIQAMRQKGLLSKIEPDLKFAEYLYHPITSDGRLIWEVLAAEHPENPVEVKEDLINVLLQEPKGEARQPRLTGRKTLERPMFATLLRKESLQGRPGVNPYLRDGTGKPLPRYAIAIVKDNPGANTRAKAQALIMLLRNNFLSHVCVSLTVASAVSDLVRNHGRHS